MAELEASIKVAEEVGDAYSLVYAHGLLSGSACTATTCTGRAKRPTPPTGTGPAGALATA